MRSIHAPVRSALARKLSRSTRGIATTASIHVDVMLPLKSLEIRLHVAGFRTWTPTVPGVRATGDSEGRGGLGSTKLSCAGRDFWGIYAPSVEGYKGLLMGPRCWTSGVVTISVRLGEDDSL